MGPKQSSQAKKEEMVQGAITNHPRFQKVRLYSDKDGEYLQISIPVVNETEIVNWEKAYKKLIAWDSLLLPRSSEFKGTQICGSNGFCTISYDHYPFLLKEEIDDRSSEKKYFQNSELWYLAFTLFETANVFHSAGKKVGDVRPANVFINDNGQTKIASHLSWPQEFTNYEKSVFDRETTYLAPEEVIDLNFGHTEPRGNFQIAEAFSVGLTLLDSVLLLHSSDLYNIGVNRFQYQRLEQRIQRLSELSWIDEYLKQLIVGLCRVNPSERLRCRQIYKWLSNYKESIINIQPLQINEVPPFLKKNINQTAMFNETQVRRVPPPNVQSQKVVIRHSGAPGVNQIRYIQQPVYRMAEVKYERVPEVFIQRPQSNVQPVVYQPNRNEQQAIKRIQVKQTKLIEEKKGEGQQIGLRQQSGGSKSVGSDDFRLTLDKIEEQLALSRKMFPS